MAARRHAAPESEFIDSYQASRTMVRLVFDLLAHEGLIYRQRGRGTFGAHPTIEQTQVRIVSFTEDMGQRGLQHPGSGLEAALLPAPLDIAEILNAFVRRPVEQALRPSNCEAFTPDREWRVTPTKGARHGHSLPG